MNFARPEAKARQALVEFANGRLAVGKDDRGFNQIVFEEPAQRVFLRPRFHRHLEGGNISVGRSRAAHLDPLGIGEKLLRQLFNRRRHRGRKQHRLARFGQLGTNEFDVGNEPHVEHPVSLVDHQQFAAVEHDLAAFKQIHQPARRRNQHIDPFRQRLQLIAHLHAADQQRHFKIVVLAVFLEILGHLRGEFTGRFKDQRTRHQRAAAARGHHIDHRQHEAGGLAGAGLGNADQVAHHQYGGDSLRLNGSWRGIACVFDGFEQFRREAEIGECHAVGGVRK